MFFKRSQPIESLKVIVIGAGEVGYHIALRLVEEKKQVVVIDQHAAALERIAERMDAQTILGSGSSPEVLLKAGVADASIVLAVTDSDNVNLIACLFANALAPSALKLARIRDEEYTARADILRSAALNISLLVNPEDEIARAIERQLSLPGAVEYGELGNGRVRMVAMRLEQHDPLVGHQLTQFRNIVGDERIMIGAIVRAGELIVPSGSDEIREGDLVYFVYLSSDQRALLKTLHRKRVAIDTVCIVGGGNIGFKLARRLEGKGLTVKLIESDAARCDLLADQLGDTLVLHGDGTDKSLLEEERIAHADAFVSVTGDEETNILSCLLAKSMGVRETVARVNKAAYLPLVEAVGIDHSVSPRLSAVNSILHYIRPGGILSAVSVGGDAAEVLEIGVKPDSALAGTCIVELGLPKGALLLAILRKEASFIPSGKTRIAAGDRVIILVARPVMTAVETILTRARSV